VVSFCGNLPPPRPEDDKNIKAKILVLHGADDPLVNPQEIELFQESMKKSGADWQMIYYGSAEHGFINPSAGEAKITGVAYDGKAEKRAWKHMIDFFEEVIPLR
jgi:dienelactone hydrolase